jgi:hypothetical protein
VLALSTTTPARCRGRNLRIGLEFIYE